MSLTVSYSPYSVTAKAFTAQPFGYETSDVSRGQAARSWAISALLTPADGVVLLQLFDAWRAVRNLEGDPLVTGVVGTTVTLSGTTTGITWTNVPCWFNEAPALEAVGGYVQAAFTVVDAAEALALLVAEQEANDDFEPNYGTLAVGGVTLTLLSDPEEYADGPEVELASTGTDVIRGPLVARRIRRVEGWTTNAGDIATLRSWYESQVAARPSAGSWYPVEPPTREIVQKATGGTTTLRHVIRITLRQIG